MESLPEASVNGCLAPTESVLSMNMRGLKPRRVVEVYIKRSLSLREDGARNKELKWQSLPAKIPQRNINHREGPGLTVPATYGRLRERESQAPGTQTAPPVSNSSSVEPCAVKEAGRGRSKDGKKGKKSQTFLGKIASFLWRRKGDEKKDEGCKRSKEFGSPQAERPSEENREQLDSQEAPEELATAHKSKSKRKNSLRRVFSFKRNNSEVKGFGSGGPGANKSKAVRPTRLDLGDVCRPKPGKTDLESEHLYEQVSEEVDRIVRTVESNEGNENTLNGRNLVEEPETDGPRESVDNSIYKIIEILQKVGDDVDTELQGDSLLSTFFKDISYNSFKELADQYIEHEVRSKVTQENPDFVKFAFTLDFTAKVAGICDHQVKRITGFGSQYLQETCWQLPSFSEQQETANNIEKIPSPD
ncbi:uncharacterized protein LOC121281942 isoform X1 [Carcharodon carcharias]|uniref:uncharacterized protein LOC121281942 isoform X1 n=1 Tax=Carcharodon carcharias TaxID=13397 RepID=UPI001B7EC762|nr:uncharacterized protein LOC121281942 isoform X1 [Carcharodon carcharias]XP_041051107.1 uncharacterized protein LOC121281942 isoform X1 [Carcharodon carcharias]XP_041051108.1 uncharacterized protein LOC121281942 isoform X1 [Carcharodon carcharias]XP_041051110.1 uncharacterized protein LOC121281942 isoform X1 [Carcharodon carcharias]XP_041051111.1 uncharacterized protein LOC121281942 isoform X1 [Carcharodon carcharias]XP_041051112.1 uncharacterized protein LOC121281942 isoform X1 [Carcharodon